MGTIIYQCVKEILKSEYLLVEVITTEATNLTAGLIKKVIGSSA